jgi:putative effector of murein hydrolase LrgA (UPF0299 family)
VAAALIALFGDSKDFTLQIMCTYGTCTQYTTELIILYFLLALGLLDWILTFRSLQEATKNILRPLALIFIPLTIGGIALLSTLFFYLFELLSKYELATLIFKISAITIGIIVAVAAIKKIITLSIHHIKDKNLLNNIKIPQKISRLEISTLFSSLLTNRGRLQLVRKLEGERIEVTGDWPTDFKLAAGLGEPVSALARLEERWLKLDR